MPGRFTNSQSPNVATPESVGGGPSSPLHDERKISIVRTAGIAQDALGHMVEEEETSSDIPKESTHFPFSADRLRPWRLTIPSI